jgi:hypothetical protein
MDNNKQKSTRQQDGSSNESKMQETPGAERAVQTDIHQIDDSELPQSIKSFFKATEEDRRRE